MPRVINSFWKENVPPVSQFLQYNTCILFLWSEQLITSIFYPFLLQRVKGKENRTKIDNVAAEIKVLIMTSCFLIIYFIAMVTNSFYIWKADSIHSAILANIQCESKGRQTGSECSRESFEPLHSIFYTINNVLINNYSLVLIIFLVDFRSLKKLWYNKTFAK